MIVMLRQRIIGLCLFLPGLAAVEGQTTLPDFHASEMASLFVSSNVNGASVYLDSLFLGVTPLERNDVSPGVYRLRVLHSNHRSWYRKSIEEIIELRPDQRFVYHADFEYVYQIRSIPFGAKISFDNSFVGETRCPQIPAST